MKQFIAGIAALTLLSVNAAAVEPKISTFQGNEATQNSIFYQIDSNAPVLTKTSECTSSVAAYEYHPFDKDYSGIYINEFYCDTSHILIVADDGKGYEVADFTPFLDGSFSCTLRYMSNGQMIRSMKAATKDQRRTETPSYVLRLSDNAITDDISATFSATYIASEDVELTVKDPTNKNNQTQTLKVANGAKIVVNYRMNVNYERLNKLQFTPKYNVDFDSLRYNGSAGIESEVLYPDDEYENSSADYCWESLGRICAEIEASDSASLSHVPRLSTFWTDGTLLKRFSENSAFIRDFGSTDLKTSVQLAITNPFVTFEGEEVLPHKDIVIYEYTKNRLKNVTKQFRYSKNTDNDGAFITSTKRLGVYIFSDKEV